jgi:hypothetical protein
VTNVFVFSTKPRPALGNTYNLIEKATEALAPGLKRKWHKADCLSSSRTTNNKLRALSPRENYTYRATVACWRNWFQICGSKVPRGQRDGYLRPYSRISRPEPLPFLPSCSSIILTRLSGPRYRPTTSQKML